MEHAAPAAAEAVAEDEAGAIQDAEAATEDEAEEEFWSNAKVLGYAASLLPEFATQRASIGSQGAWVPFAFVRIPPPAGLAAALEEEDKRILGAAADAFFWGVPNDNPQRGRSKRKVLQSTPVPAVRMESTASIVAGWQELFERRRAVHPVDADPIPDPDVKTKIWNCLLSTSDAADDSLPVDLRVRRRLQTQLHPHKPPSTTI